MVASLLVSAFAVLGLFGMATTKAPEGMSGMGYGFGQAIVLSALPAIPVLIAVSILRPRRSACRTWVVVSTVFLTAAVPAAVWMWPKKADLTYEVVFSIVDEAGKLLQDCEVNYKLEPPELQHRGISKILPVSGGNLTITKKRGENLYLQVRARDFCILDVEIGHWFYDVPDYIHKVNLSWRHDNSGMTSADNSCHTAVNWRPASQGPLRLIMLRIAGPPKSPYPPYTEETYRELEANRPP